MEDIAFLLVDPSSQNAYLLCGFFEKGKVIDF